ncbi:ABC transporter permease [Pelomonas sp. SE-A7]|uniref:ABC transporter permease n=1 Tax=Pelomonas sp. SE-A7 TaxID=3054953 RepID=UPI00259C9E9A|nr:ABC transporter permease [Pelomonas sp. SE-A7]MDM4764947.1 ABC transporter permease [Pelomonas sp. SE-A7]
MQALMALVAVQIRLYLSNRRALLINLAMPIVIAAFFGSLFGGKGGDDKPLQVKVAVVDEDRSELSQRIVKAMSEDASLKVELLDRAAAEDLVLHGKLRAGLLLPAGFGERAGRSLMSGGTAEKIAVDLIYDPSEKMAKGLLAGLFSQHAMQQTMSHAFSGQSGARLMDEGLQKVREDKGMDEGQKAALTQLFGSLRDLQQRQDAASAPQAGQGGAMAAMSPPFKLQERALSSGQQGYNGYAHAFAGMGVQFVLFMGVELGVAILMSRRAGLWLRLRSAPLSRFSLLGSHFCSTTLIASSILAIVMLTGMLIFGYRVGGSWLGLGLIVFGYGLFTAGFGLFLSAMGGSPEATRGLAILATLLMMMLGGAWVPSFVFPQWVQELTVVVPVRWAVDGLDAMTWRGLEVIEAVKAFGVLLFSGLLLAALAWWRFDWNE